MALAPGQRSPKLANMGFRFRRSVSIIPGLRLNLSKSGASVSVGPKGLHYTVGPKGTRITAGIPGTGLSWTEYTAHGTNNSPPPVPDQIPAFQSATRLVDIESAPAGQINALSTSELAPILNGVYRRIRLTPLVLLAALALFCAAYITQSERLIELVAFHTVLFVSIGIFLDRYRRSVKIEYQTDAAASQVASAFVEAFTDLKSCAYVWSIRAKGDTADWKRNAGATTLIKRKRTYPQLKRPSCLRGNVAFPTLSIGSDELHFLPDAMLVVDSGAVAALHYKDFTLSIHPKKFIEEETLPPDSEVIGQTWRYVNKSGGPDRRFASNRQIPVCMYGEMDFTSVGGLNGIVHLSNATAGDRLANVIEVLRTNDAPLSQSKPVKSLARPKRWPSVLYLSFFLLFELALGSITFLIFPDLQNRPVAIAPAPIVAPAPSRAIEQTKPKVDVPLPRPRPFER